MNILNGLLFLYIDLRKHVNLQSEAKLEQIIAIVTTHSIFLFVLYLNKSNDDKVFSTSLVAYSKIEQLYKLPHPCQFFWFQELAKELLYDEGYT